MGISRSARLHPPSQRCSPNLAQSWKVISLLSSPPSSPCKPGKCVLPEKVQTQSSLCEGATGPQGPPCEFSFLRGSAQGASRPCHAPSHYDAPQNPTVVRTAPGTRMSFSITSSSSNTWQRPPSDPEDKWESPERWLLLCNRKPVSLSKWRGKSSGASSLSWQGYD